MGCVLRLVYIILCCSPAIGWDFSVGSYEIQGRRPYQEDRHVTHRRGNIDYFAVFDGHGGSQASSFSVAPVPFIILDLLEENGHHQDYEILLTRAYKTLDEEFLDMNVGSGSTALIAIIEHGKMWVANTGDCRGVMSRGGRAEELSVDHKPNRPDELQRIKDAGSFAENVMGIWRVERTLAMSRAIGDAHLKHVVIPDPEVKIYDLQGEHEGEGIEDKFIILGSDGLWDVMENQDAVDFVRMNPSLRNDPRAAAKALTMLAYQLGSLDNITVMVILLLRNKAKPEAQHQEL